MKKTIVVPASTTDTTVTIDIPDPVTTYTQAPPTVAAPVIKTTQADPIITMSGSATPIPPIVVPSKGFTLMGLKTSGAISYNGKSDIVIENLIFTTGLKVAIYLLNCQRITIRNCYFPQGKQYCIDMRGTCTDITMDGNFFPNARQSFHSQDSTLNNLKYINNQVWNVHADNSGDQYTNGQRGNAWQFNNVKCNGAEFSGNKVQMDLDISNAEDLVGMYKAVGTASAPILIKNNTFLGGSGVGKTGGGIQTGDGGGAWITADGNILYGPVNFGISASGGTNITISNNVIVGRTDGKQGDAFSGIYVINFSAPAVCNLIKVFGNKTQLVAGKPYINDQSCTNVTDTVGTNDWKATGYTTPSTVLSIAADSLAQITADARIKL